MYKASLKFKHVISYSCVPWADSESAGGSQACPLSCCKLSKSTNHSQATFQPTNHKPASRSHTLVTSFTKYLIALIRLR